MISIYLEKLRLTTDNDCFKSIKMNHTQINKIALYNFWDRILNYFNPKKNKSH